MMGVESIIRCKCIQIMSDEGVLLTSNNCSLSQRVGAYGDECQVE